MSSRQLLDDFITSTMVCMANALYNIEYCYAIYLRSARILNLPSDKESFTLVFTKTKDKYSEYKVSTYAEYLLHNILRVNDIWKYQAPEYVKTTIHIDNIRQRIEFDGNVAGWPMTDAIYIWQWLHIIAVHLDLNTGLDEKIAFINFIPNIVACGVCKHHYSMHKDELLKSLRTTSCTNALLALHTFINDTRSKDDGEEKQFVYSKSLIDLYFHKKYRNDYLKLLITKHNKTFV